MYIKLRYLNLLSWQDIPRIDYQLFVKKIAVMMLVSNLHFKAIHD
jgi:hypothetical protein